MTQGLSDEEDIVLEPRHQADLAEAFADRQVHERTVADPKVL
jgi:hypothetical protein